MDYLIFISDCFFKQLNRFNENEIRRRSISVLVLMIYFPSMLLISTFYMLAISLDLLLFNKISYFILFIGIYICMYISMRRYYNFHYDRAVSRYEVKLRYSKNKISVIFIFCLFIAFFSFWAGLLFFRFLLY